MSVSFNPHSPWKKGDIIKTEDLDRYENGIVNLINASDQMSTTLGESATSGPIGLGNNTNLENADVKDSENKDKKGYLITAGALIDASNIAKGWVRLNSDGIVPSELLPSYVDDVLVFEDYNHFPGVDSSTGEIISEVNTDNNPNDSHAPVGPEEGKIYIAADTGYTYRWYDKEVNNERECGYALIGVADLDYTDSNYPTTDPETTDWDKYYVKRVTQADGKISVEHALFNPSITWTSAVSNVNNGKPSINISIAGNPSTVLIPDEASTNVYGITKLSSAIDSNSEVLAATPKAVKDAIESLDVDNLSSEDSGYDANKAHITGFGADKTLASLTETDGKINATFQNISITSDKISDRGTAGCVATLDSNGHVPSSQLPSYVDDVLEYANRASFPSTGESGKIYIALDTNLTYRWSSSTYVEISQSLALGETSSTAYRGDYGKVAYNHAQAHGVKVGTETTVIDSNTGEEIVVQTTKFLKIRTNGLGHVMQGDPVTKYDIQSLGIPISSYTAFQDDDSLSLVTRGEKYIWDNKYTLPTGGIPNTDISSSVFTDTAFILTPTTGGIEFSDGTNTITFTMSDLQALKALLNS